MTEIIVDKKLVRKCKARAKAIAQFYAKTGRTNTSFSKGVYSKNKAINVYTFGTIGEVALLLFLGIDPEPYFLRSVEHSDGGVDVEVNGHTIDVKSSDHPFASRLMWPVKMIDKLPHAAENFVMARVAVAPTEDEGRVVRLVGWVTRDEFIAQHHKAYRISGIVDGTPYMNEKSLYSMDEIVQHLGRNKATEQESDHG
jgi:hypothetical protein